jgi:hypothetical protein
MAQDISGQRLAKLREKPLHRHCRELLEKAGKNVDLGTLGAPELMLWGLEQPDIQAAYPESSQIWGLVEMLLGKPSFADRAVMESVAGDESALLEVNDPNSLARQLLKRFTNHIGGFSV